MKQAGWILICFECGLTQDLNLALTKPFFFFFLLGVLRGKMSFWWAKIQKNSKNGRLMQFSSLGEGEGESLWLEGQRRGAKEMPHAPQAPSLELGIIELIKKFALLNLKVDILGLLAMSNARMYQYLNILQYLWALTVSVYQSLA